MSEAVEENTKNSSDKILWGYTSKERLLGASIDAIIIPLIIILASYLAEVNYNSRSIAASVTNTNNSISLENNQGGIIDYIGISEMRMKNLSINFHQVNPESLILPETLLNDLNRLIDSGLINYSDIEWLLTLHELALEQFSNSRSFEEGRELYSTTIEVKTRLESIVNQFES